MDIKNVPYIIQGRQLNHSSMLFISAVNKEDLQQRFVNRLSRVFLIEVLILLVFTLIFYLLTRRAILPLNKLSGLMSEAEKGNYLVKADLNQYREISDLSRQFNSMVDGIKTRDAILKNREVEIKNLAYYDSLTGLPNRVFLQNTLRELMKKLSREQRILN